LEREEMLESHHQQRQNKCTGSLSTDCTDDGVEDHQPASDEESDDGIHHSDFRAFLGRDFHAAMAQLNMARNLLMEKNDHERGTFGTSGSTGAAKKKNKQLKINWAEKLVTKTIIIPPKDPTVWPWMQPDAESEEEEEELDEERDSKGGLQ
jgi:hypothetical protein